MPATDRNWYELNATRPFPFSDGATLVADDGIHVPVSVLADAQVIVPASAGRYVFVSAIHVGPSLTSIVLQAADSLSATTFTPLASASVAGKVSQWEHVPLSPLYPGVAGYVVFGDTSQQFHARFSSPQQSYLVPHAVRTYQPPGVFSLRKHGSGTALQGLVRLRGEGDLEVVGQQITLPGETTPRTVAAIRLRTQAEGFQLLEKYAGPCGVRPESDNCPVPPLQTLGGVQPDCDGNIKLKFVGMTGAKIFDSSGKCVGIALDYPMSLDDVCVPVENDPLAGSSGTLSLQALDQEVVVADFRDASHSPDHYHGNWYYLPDPDYWGDKPGRHQVHYLEGEAPPDRPAIYWVYPQHPVRPRQIEFEATLLLTEPGVGGIVALPASPSGKYLWALVDTGAPEFRLSYSIQPDQYTVWTQPFAEAEFPYIVRIRLRLAARGRNRTLTASVTGPDGQEYSQTFSGYLAPTMLAGLTVVSGHVGFYSFQSYCQPWPKSSTRGSGTSS